MWQITNHVWSHVTRESFGRGGEREREIGKAKTVFCVFLSVFGLRVRYAPRLVGYSCPADIPILTFLTHPLISWIFMSSWHSYPHLFDTPGHSMMPADIPGILPFFIHPWMFISILWPSNPWLVYHMGWTVKQVYTCSTLMPIDINNTLICVDSNN